MDPIQGLMIALGIFTLFYVVTWFQGARQKAAEGFPRPVELVIGALTNFFDTLGIGSYAPTTALFRSFKLVKDEWIPGTLNIGHTLPTVLQAFFFIGAVSVDVTTLVLMIAAAAGGAFLGARIVAGWPRRNIQLGMGIALVCAAALFAARNLDMIKIGGTSDGVSGVMLVVAVVVNFFLGALMTIGIGLYAPCMILISFLGMNDRAAFPIMMGSCAFLMTAATQPFVRKGAYSLKAALGLAIGGLPAVWVAAKIVKELPLANLRWLVAVVVLYTGVTMLRSAFSKETASS